MKGDHGFGFVGEAPGFPHTPIPKLSSYAALVSVLFCLIALLQLLGFEILKSHPERFTENSRPTNVKEEDIAKGFHIASGKNCWQRIKRIPVMRALASPSTDTPVFG